MNDSFLHTFLPYRASRNNDKPEGQCPREVATYKTLIIRKLPFTSQIAQGRDLSVTVLTLKSLALLARRDKTRTYPP